MRLEFSFFLHSLRLTTTTTTTTFRWNFLEAFLPILLPHVSPMYSEVQLHVKSFRSTVLVQLPSFLHGFGRQGSSVERYTQSKAVKLFKHAAAQKWSLMMMPKLEIRNFYLLSWVRCVHLLIATMADKYNLFAT